MGEKEKIPLVRGGHFVCGDLRKFAEQLGDVLQWDQSNQAYILTHGISGLNGLITNIHYPNSSMKFT